MSTIFINITPRELNSAENNNVSNNSLTVNVDKENKNLSANNNWTGSKSPVSLKAKIIVGAVTLIKEVGNMTLSRENQIKTKYLSSVTVWTSMSKDRNC